jgi:integrase
MISPHNVTAAIGRLTRRVLGRAEGPHELRHYCATELLRVMSPADVAYHLGHASAAITLSVYASPSAEASTQAAGFLDRAVGWE